MAKNKNKKNLDPKPAKLDKNSEVKTEEVGADPQLKIAELQTTLQSKREELQLRERLSKMTNEMRMKQSDTAAASKMAVEAFKNLGQETGGTEDG